MTDPTTTTIETLVRDRLIEVADQADMQISIRQVHQLADAVTTVLTPTPTDGSSRTPRQLTEFETACLTGLANGLTQAQIAELSGATVTTVGKRLTTLYRGLGARNQTQAVAIALTTGVLHPGAVGPLAAAVRARQGA